MHIFKQDKERIPFETETLGLHRNSNAVRGFGLATKIEHVFRF
jgi:hypothetical protein